MLVREIVWDEVWSVMQNADQELQRIHESRPRSVEHLCMEG